MVLKPYHGHSNTCMSLQPCVGISPPAWCCGRVRTQQWQPLWSSPWSWTLHTAAWLTVHVERFLLGPLGSFSGTEALPVWNCPFFPKHSLTPLLLFPNPCPVVPCSAVLLSVLSSFYITSFGLIVFMFLVSLGCFACTMNSQVRWFPEHGATEVKSSIKAIIMFWFISNTFWEQYLLFSYYCLAPLYTFSALLILFYPLLSSCVTFSSPLSPTLVLIS